ncbi:hypothetical protein [Desulfonatronum thioautotrophicum]|uniref:hypothetical protein n=1 Tax=Desulfonatronum thioautotrophicum TaxID=617001 RepID=UPI00129475FB|nr:hypothetical protein [Desulfonatronum thioautotrophicum]
MDHAELKQTIDNILSDMKIVVDYLKNSISNQDNAILFQKIKNIERTIEKMKSQSMTIPEELTRMKLSLYFEYERQKELMQIRNYLNDSVKAILFPHIRFPKVKRKSKVPNQYKKKQQQLPLCF